MLSAPVWRGFGPFLFFGIGLMLGASSIAFVAAVLGGLIQTVLPTSAGVVLLGMLALAVLVREAGLVRFPVPENRRLVPERVLQLGRVFGPVQFGFELGTGMRTYSPSALPHLMLSAIVLILPWPAALAAAVGFSAARWFMAAASSAHSDDGSWTKLWQIHRRLLAVATAVATIGSLSAGVMLGW